MCSKTPNLVKVLPLAIGLRLICRHNFRRMQEKSASVARSQAVFSGNDS